MVRWKEYLRGIAKCWPEFSTTGEVHVHGILVTFSAMRKSPLDEEGFIRAVKGSQERDLRYVPLKRFYEDVSRGRLRFGNVTAESFSLEGDRIDENRAYEQFFKQALEGPRRFSPRTHFMFGFDQAGASGDHLSYRLKFSSQMSNESSLIHEFGHNLGLYHATTPGSDRGDESDRMGAPTGYLEFNAPNLIHLQWLDESSVRVFDTSGDYVLRPLEYSNAADEVPKVLTIPISDRNYLYFSTRDRIGPYDSKYLDARYVRQLSIHTRTLDSRGEPKKTCLLAVLGDGECFLFNDPTLLRNCKEVVVSDLRREGDELRFHIHIRH